jgi:stage II sporulation protein P
MYRYRMGSKPRRFGWLVAAVIIGLLLLVFISQLGGQQSTSGSSTITESSGESGVGGTLLQWWGNLKAGAATLWQTLTGQGGAAQVSISLDEEDADGSGDDEEDISSGDVQVELTTPQIPAAFVPAGASPQVLIYHTHSYEAYDKQSGQDYLETSQWRTKDNDFNISAVGEALSKQLSAKYGIVALHDETDNECSQLGTAYSRSLKTMQKDLSENPGLKILIDLHRDAYSAGINPHTVTVNGKQAARVMIVVGTGAGQTGVGFTIKPDWQKNLLLAQAITDRLNAFDPQLARKVDIKTGRYNQHLSTGAILIEVGDNKNTLDEALATVPFLAQAIADVYSSMSFAGTVAPSASPSPAPSVSPSVSPTASQSSSPPASPTASGKPTPTSSPSGPVQEVISIEPVLISSPPENKTP